MAQQVLTQFQEHPDAWQRVPGVLQQASNLQTKVCSLSVSFGSYKADHTFDRSVHWSSSFGKANPNSMEGSSCRAERRYVALFFFRGEGFEQPYRCVARFKAQTRSSPIGIRNFIVGVIMEISSDEANLRRQKVYINKLNLILVQVSDPIHFLHNRWMDGFVVC